MKRIVFSLMVFAGCGTAEPMVNEPTPVASTPLSGTVGGAAWAAVSATASARRSFSDDGGERWIDIGSGAFDCSDFVPEAQIIGVFPWKVDAYALSFNRNLTFVVHEADGGIENLVATNGRVEVISAPDAGTATLRIRARYDAENEIEGQIDVTICD